MNKIVKELLVFVLLIGMLFCLTGCCSHVWEDGNCTTPKTCKECGATEGDVVHVFEEYDCMEKRKCTKCESEIEAIGHKWIEATCYSPKKCEVCDETEGDALGHLTRYGECSRCGNEINDVEYKDGYIIVTYSDTNWMQEKDDFVDICVIGTIEEITDFNDFIIVDSEGKKWTADVGTGRDFSKYIGTVCEIYGSSSGGTSSVHDTPYININDEDHIKFSDGKILYPDNFESEKQFKDKYVDNSEVDGTVWIPTDGGKKYHSKSTCSGMDNPQSISKNEAINKGYSKCGKCW